MKYEVRNYKHSDYPMLCSWWKERGEACPSKSMLPLNSTFILEKDGKPIYSISAYATNCSGISFLENFIKNPSFSRQDQDRDYSQLIVDYAVRFLKDNGYERVVCFSYKDNVKKRYEELGMTKTLDNLSSFVREI
jgi:hypothetical protein